ncbi:YitT family protein [Paenibacillus tengchongensis]|uniref:YitT family protein n=1 Tax=Paenibacillus tengchongensis TaxID=2608684 RepID=UPI00124D1BAF|nr:YitT family protein [Paenibacillus tengchongensis]
MKRNYSGEYPPLHRRKGVRTLSVIAGGLIAAVGLELFLMPHKLITGGIAGLSALLSHMTEMRLGLFLFLLNLPFILLSRKQINLKFALYTMLGLICLTAGSLALHRFPAVITEPLPAALAGGLCLGLGLGISIRFGGVGGPAPESGFMFLRSGPPKWAETALMLLNCAILLCAGALFGWDQAMYSILAYLLAFEGVRFSLRDLTRSRPVWITTSRCTEIKAALRDELERESKLVQDAGPEGQPGTLFCLASRMEEEALTTIVHSFDRQGEIVIGSQTRRMPFSH